MNRSLPTKCRAIVALLVMATLPAAGAAAQSPRDQTPAYRPPNFAGMTMQPRGGVEPISAFPASPLAGGPAAAQGGEFMDVEGRRIVLPAQYSEPYPEGSMGSGFCPPGAGGYGDPMAIDFGGYGADQCGPHYFDVSFGTVWLQGEDFYQGAEFFSSAGVGLGAPRYLNPAGGFGEYEPGWEIAARYDIGALAVLEATYMGLYDIGYSDQVQSVDVAPGGVDFQLFSVWSNYGTTGQPISGIDDGRTHAVDYAADLQSTEISYRRYWVGQNPRVSGSWLLGARYLRFTDDFTFNSVGLVIPTLETASLNWAGENDMVGFQFGGDAWMCLRQGLRLGVEGTAGVYNNRYKFFSSGTFSANPATAPNVPADFTSQIEGNQVAFATEAEISMVADILPSWSLRGGYRVLFLNSLATGANNINQSTLAAAPISTQAGLLFHGFQGGLEYVW